MSRGKRKGSARTEAKAYPHFADKLAISIHGRVAKYHERLPYVEILNIPMLRANAASYGLTPAKLEKRVRKIKKWAEDATVEAIKKNDDRFFERMAEIARFYKDRKTAADELGAAIMGAIGNMRRLGQKRTCYRIAKHINRVYPRSDGGEWDAKDVRDATNVMGVKTEKGE
jgi:hypothetical protein